MNQYTNIEYSAVSPATCYLSPTYDADGNQTLAKTATGIWSVTYNGENRPIRWTQGTNTISMTYDRMGRRVTKGDQRFVYDGYLQIANVHSTTTTSNYNYYIWDPSEPVATRPLVWNRNGDLSYYVFDGNKNVSEVVAAGTDVAAHYEYAPFGALTISRGESAAANPWRFSSEYAEDDTATVYYNYRHYEPGIGRWLSRDAMGEIDVYGFVNNSSADDWDELGLFSFQDLMIEAAGYDKAWAIPPAGIPVGLGGARLMIVVSASGYLFNCCNDQGYEETWVHGNLGIEAYVIWGYAGKTKGWQGKGRDRNKRDPETGRKNKNVHPENKPSKGFKDRDVHADTYFTNKKCPQESWFGGYLTVFVRGTGGCYYGVQVNVQRTWNLGDNADGSDLDISASAARGVYGVSIEFGAGGGMVGEFRAK